MPVLSRLLPDLQARIRQADARIRPYVRETYIDPSPFFSELGGAEVFFKCENLQHTGSFKVRGALNKVLVMSPEERSRGAVTASTGNHGAAFAYALNQVGAEGIVFVPETASSTKVAAIRRLGARVETFGRDSVETEAHARAYAQTHGMTYVPPYNDLDVIAGQGTIAVELVRQLGQVDAVFASVGGGGLISGVAAHLKNVLPEVQIIGCSPENSQVMAQSVRAGRLLDLPSLPTLSDGTAGGVEPDSVTFPLCQALVDDWVEVGEEAIADNLRAFMAAHHMMIEGSAAVAIAGYLRLKERFAGKRVAIILCGANIDLDVLHHILTPPPPSHS